MGESKILILRNSLFVMKHAGFWPKSETKTNSYISTLIIFISCAPLMFTNIFHVIFLMRAEHKVGLAENVATIASHTGCYYIISCFVMKQKSLRRLFENLSNFKNFGKPQNFDALNNRLEVLSKFMFYYVYFASGVYAVSAVLEIPKCKELNEELGLEEVCGMFNTGYYHFDIDYFPVKQIVFVYQLSAVCILVTGAVMASSAAFEASFYIMTKIEHLKTMLMELYDAEDYNVQRRRLNFLIQYHCDINETSEHFNLCFKNLLGVHILLTGVVCGCLFFQCVQDKTFGSIVHMLGWLFILFINCFAGEQLIFESTSIIDAAYEAKWYKAELDLQKDLQFLILRAQKPLYINVTPIGYLSLPLFVSIVKASYSYLTLLNGTV